MGACGYDLRIFFDKNGKVEFRHGLCRYSADCLYELLDYARDNNIIVRILFELRGYNKRFTKNVDELKSKFVLFCKEIEERYPEIRFYGGRCSGDWELLYTFKNEPIINLVDLYSSMTSLFVLKKKWLSVIDDWCPYIYAKLMNVENICEYSGFDDDCYVSIDVIDIQ